MDITIKDVPDEIHEEIVKLSDKWAAENGSLSTKNLSAYLRFVFVRLVSEP